jgi:type IV pilus assembly protein PilW
MKTLSYLSPRHTDVALRKQRGLTLIELMAGLALGMLTTVVIAQVMASSEGQRRSTAVGSDAQTNGAVALYTLQREIMGAGYGLTERRDAFGCVVAGQPVGSPLAVLEPLRIVDGGADGEPDTLRVIASVKGGFSTPMRVTTDTDPTVNRFNVGHTLGLEVGDVVLSVPPTTAAGTCTLMNVTAVGNASFDHIAGADAPLNAAPGSGPTAGMVFQSNSTIINMGGAAVREYGVSNRNTMVERVLNAGAGAFSAEQDLFANVVNMQVFYGKDINNDDAVDVYNTTQPMTGADWRQVRTIRLVVVAKSGQRERDEVTPAQPVVDLGAAPTVTGGFACGTSQCLRLKVDADPDWKQFHYKVFDTVVPVRNILWNLQP